jgi:hypothetical protein
MTATEQKRRRDWGWLVMVSDWLWDGGGANYECYNIRDKYSREYY